MGLPLGKGGGGETDYIFGLGLMTKMAVMPINGKNLKNLLLQYHQADCLESWYVAIV